MPRPRTKFRLAAVLLGLALTAAGLAVLNENRPRVTILLDVLKRVGRRLGKAQEAFEGPESDSTTAAQPPAVALDTVRRDLKAALFDCLDESPEEQQRVAAILQRTIAEIRKR